MRLPAGIAEHDFNNAGEWGALVESNGRAQTFHRDLGNGNAVVTFFIWAQ